MHHTPIVATLTGLLLLSGWASGQGSRADYDRAATLRARTSGLVLNERVRPVWLPGGSLVARLDQPGGGHRYTHVDSITGAQRDAFDHDEVARLTEAQPDRLPVRSIRFRQEDGRLELIVGQSRRDALTLSVRPSGRDLRTGPSADPIPLPPEDLVASRGGDVEIELTFENDHDVPVHVEWLDHAGRARRYATIEPGGTHRQHTFSGHAWRVTDDAGTDLGRFRGPTHDAIVRIDGQPFEQAPVERGEVDPLGTTSVFSEGWNLRAKDLATGTERALTTDGTAQDWYTGRIHWSPDQRFVGAVRRTRSEQRLIHLIDAMPADQLQPEHHTLNYRKPGDAIDQDRICLIDMTTGASVDVDHSLSPNPWSIGPIWWSADSSELLFVYHERGHRVRRIIGIDPQTGAARALVDERADTFIDYSQKTHAALLDDGDRVLWMSERSGWNHLYMVDRRDDSIRALTEGPWVVRRVLGVHDSVLFEAMGVFPDQDPYHVHVGRVALDGGPVTWLTESDGTHSIEIGDATYLATWSRVDHPPVHELRRTEDGSLICEVARADWTALLETGWRAPERFSAPGRDLITPIWGIIHTPTNFDPSTPYPVVEQIYAGPHGHHVPKRFSSWHGAQSVAELGFVVVQIDGMGTNWRSKAFHDVCWKNIGDAGFPDRIRWMREAGRERPWMDLSHVGIYGGSAGGQNAMRALLFHNDFYSAAVADCGCHDNRMDKIWWNEAWMGWPVDASYERSSNVVHAHRLEGDLMLILGAMDRNVDPMSTMQVVEALTRADKDFELVVIPSAGHGAAGTPYGARRQHDFLVKSLMGRTPRWE